MWSTYRDSNPTWLFVFWIGVILAVVAPVDLGQVDIEETHPYRKLKGYNRPTGNDDFSMMSEVLMRALLHQYGSLPGVGRRSVLENNYASERQSENKALKQILWEQAKQSPLYYQTQVQQDDYSGRSLIPSIDEMNDDPYGYEYPSKSYLESNVPYSNQELIRDKPQYSQGFLNAFNRFFETRDDSDRNLLLQRLSYLRSIDREENDMTDDESPLFSEHGLGLDRLRQLNDEELSEEIPAPKPEFTYHFSKDLPDSEFAVRPNDPRFYEEGDSASDMQVDKQKLPTRNEIENSTSKQMNVMHIGHGDDSVTTNSENQMNRNFADTNTDVLVEPVQRRYHLFNLPTATYVNNDVYFIAIVAGTSAAIMFALVIMSLTWCRYQRASKAAADVEYPAYGVTGPNKDISPSGDQRLAQSAQMYHFQHQKQQIIAMENRSSATRDPGSVSEAESEEENEEGDYTVYECPGLASTGEMEVKNPLFHDDPTPATPAQTNKDEDHI